MNRAILAATLLFSLSLGCGEVPPREPDGPQAGDAGNPFDGENSEGTGGSDSSASGDSGGGEPINVGDVSNDYRPDGFGICCLCGKCDFPIRGNLVIASDGTTCDMQVRKMAGDWPEGSAKCNVAKDKYRNDCCNPNANPIPVAVETPTSTVPNIPEGNEEYCDICKGGEFPGLPKTVTNTLYVGLYTCEQLYWRGRTRNIPTRMCMPMRDFYEEPCGCGPYHPKWLTEGE